MACTSAGLVRSWWIGNTMVVQLGTLIALGDLTDEPLTDELTDTVITDATVTAQLEDAAGNPVVGDTFPVSLPHVSGGVYRGAVASALAVAAGVAYTLRITASKAGNVNVWKLPILAADRTV